MLSSPGRTIRYSPRYESEAAQIQSDVRRWDDQTAGLHAALCSNPEATGTLGPGGVWYATTAFDGATSIIVAYTITDTLVILESVRIATQD